MREPFFKREHPGGLGGLQLLYRFDNGFGASVVRFRGSFGGTEGKWELAVIHYTGEDEYSFEVRYDTAVTHSLLGFLSDAEVEELLTKIEALPPDGASDDS